MKEIRPLHLTATFSESLTIRLLKLGADPTVMTIEGQSPLMIACRARQSNLVACLLIITLNMDIARLLTALTSKDVQHFTTLLDLEGMRPSRFC